MFEDATFKAGLIYIHMLKEEEDARRRSLKRLHGAELVAVFRVLAGRLLYKRIHFLRH